MKTAIDGNDADLFPPPPPAFDPLAYPRTYRPRPVWIMLGTLAMVAFAAFGVWMLWAGEQWRTPCLDLGMPVVFFLVALLAAVELVRNRVVLHADRIERVNAFGLRQLKVEDIDSWRMLDSQHVKQVRLQPQPDRGRPMKIALTFQVDVPWQAWLDRLRSTDDEGRQAALARVLGDDELGMLPDDRLRALRRAQHVGKFAVWGIYLVGLWAIYAWRYVDQVVALCLLLPVAALWLAGAWPTLLTLREPSRADVRVSLWMALLMGAVAPLAAALKTLAMASLVPLIAPAVALGAAATAWALAADPTVRVRKAAIAGVVLPLMLYGGALAVWLNHALPPLQATRAVVTVTGTQVKRGGRGGPIYKVSLGPAPTTIDWRELDVAHSTWEQLYVGSPACLDERRGALGGTEATIHPCPGIAPGAPASAEDAARKWLASDAPEPAARMPLVQRLAEGAWEEVAQTLDDVQRRFEDGTATEADLERDFYSMETDDPAIDAPLATWVARRPQSYAAHLASAMHAQRVGARLREGGYVAATSPGLNAEQFETQARRELDMAARSTRLPLMAIEFDAAYLQSRAADNDVELMQRAVALYADDWMVRRLVLRHRPLCPCANPPGPEDAAMPLVLATNPSAPTLQRVLAERLYERGVDARQRNDTAAAESLLEQALASDGSMHDRYRAAIELASLDLMQSRFDDAVMHARRAISWVPEASRAYLFLGHAYESQHRIPEALAAYAAGAARGERDGHVRVAMLLLQRAGAGRSADHLEAGRRLAIAADQADQTARQTLRQHPDLMAAQKLDAPH